MIEKTRHKTASVSVFGGYHVFERTELAETWEKLH
jgi:hypothetical protein